MDNSTILAEEFERESHRIDQLVWDAMAIRKGESVLFAGASIDPLWFIRAVQIGADVTVIESDVDRLGSLADVGVKTVRGSTTTIPARENSYDAAIAFHYLHEVDPFFHAQIVSELARVGQRVVIVEPAPPSDPLGRRIAALYSRAKRELGAFEYYQILDYWKKLLTVVKADITSATYSFLRVPPREYIDDTVRLILETMEIEETPKPYLDELRELAKRPGGQLLPQSRYVLVAAAAGEIPTDGAGTLLREDPAERIKRANDAAIAAFAHNPQAPAPPAPTPKTPIPIAPIAPGALPSAFAQPPAAMSGNPPPPYNPAAPIPNSPFFPVSPPPTQPGSPPPPQGLPAAFSFKPTGDVSSETMMPPVNPLPETRQSGPFRFAGAPPEVAVGLPPSATEAAPSPAFGPPFAVPAQAQPPDAPFGMPPTASPAPGGWAWEPPETPVDASPFGLPPGAAADPFGLPTQPPPGSPFGPPPDPNGPKP
jgi:hypothetical protein